MRWMVRSGRTRVAAAAVMAGLVLATATVSAAAPPEIPGIAVPPLSPAVQAGMRQESRIALVIGNASYAAERLLKTRQDAQSMKTALDHLGFKVEMVPDGSKRAMDEAVDRFVQALKAKPGIGLLFYSGHGAQIDGENYLLPVDFPSEPLRTDYVYGAVSLSRAIAAMREVNKAGSNVILVDACRNNPFTKGIMAAQPGLAPVKVIGDRIAGETVIAFATEPGHVAYEGPKGSHSLFTGGVLTHIFDSGLDLADMFKRVQKQVLKESNGQQSPTLEYRAGAVTAMLVPPACSAATDEAEWGRAESLHTVEGYRAYLNRCPQGSSAKVATFAVERLADSLVAAAPRTPPPPASLPAPVGAAPLPVPGPSAAKPQAPLSANGHGILQLGIYSSDGDAWFSWTALRKRQPELTSGLTATVRLLDARNPNGGWVMKAATPTGVDARTLCRGIVGAGYGCLVVNEASD